MFNVEIIPGKSIGPIHLGMTRDEIAKLGRYAGSDRMECYYDAAGICSQISVRPVCRANRDLPETELFVLMLAERQLFDLNDKTICELCGIGVDEMQYEFCAQSFPTIGLFLEWDPWETQSGDPYRVSVLARRPPSSIQPVVPK